MSDCPETKKSGNITTKYYSTWTSVMIEMPLSLLASQFNTEFSQKDIYFHGVSTDTRTIKPGNLFVAIQGEHFDGHEFLDQAAQKGAAAALVNRVTSTTIPQIIVDDTLAAMGKLSADWRHTFTIPLIGVTGSNGKTTLKNMIASILRAACQNNADQVLATEGNLNNEIGVPLTLFRLHHQHRYGVIEMGMNHFNEISYLTKLTQPAVAVITNAAESHLEGVKNTAGVAQAKGEIFQGLQPNGTAILNADDEFFNYWRKLIPNHTCLSFGLHHPADVSAIIKQQTITLKTPLGEIDVILPLLGNHNVMNALAATAVAIALHLDLEIIKQGLENMQPAPGRMHQYRHATGARIIDDTYNANPFSLQAAVDTLTELQGTKIVVLGDMKELGEHAKSLHYTAGEKMHAAQIDYLFTLGDLSSETSRAFGHNAKHFTDKKTLTEALLPYIKENTNILVKGSRSMSMEKIIEDLIPEDQIEPTH